MSDSTITPENTTPPQPAQPGGALTLWALIVAIVAMVSAIIPVLSFVAWVPAVVATILAIVGLVSKRPGRGKAIAAAILGPIAFLVAIVVSLGTIAVGLSNASPSTESKPDVATNSPAESEPPLAPKPVVTPADTVYSGSGDNIVAVTMPDGASLVSAATITYVGEGNFAVWELDSAMGQSSLAVNTIDSYTGTVILNLDANTMSLEITASGPWTVTIHSLLALPQFDSATSGVGDAVIVYTGGAGAATLTHDGSSNFAIWSYGDDTDLVVNEVGAYSGQVRWQAGVAMVAVNADGNWSITVE